MSTESKTANPFQCGRSPPVTPGILQSREKEWGHNPFPIVGIGAAARGLEAYTQLLSHLPDKTGMAFLIVQHLDLRHENRLAELLSRSTRIPVLEATHGLAVQPDHAYVIPPNSIMAIAYGLLQIAPRIEGHGPHLPVDHLFRSLAMEQQSRAIGVVLSGTGSDGTLGLCEIKAAGGITFAQDEGSARHAGMPGAAVGSGCVDMVISPETIAERLAQIAAHPYLCEAASPGEAPRQEQDRSVEILRKIQSSTGVDLTDYADGIIRRRIMRRMALHGKKSIADYLEMLESDRGEIDTLYRDLLINVAGSLRERAMFAHGRFRSTPPRAKEAPRSAKEKLSAVHEQPRPLRVLVVDDNYDLSKSLGMLMRHLGYDVRVAYDGLSAVQEAVAFQPDVGLIDIGLPGVNGYELARQIRQHPTLGKMTLIAQTGYGTAADRQLAHHAGFDHHLVKPVEPNDLEKLLAGLH